MQIRNQTAPNNDIGIRIILIFFIFLSFSSLLYSLRTILTTTAPDFSVYYTATKALVRGDNPYKAEGLFTGVGYPPHSLLPYMPLTLLPYMAAQNMFTVLSLAALFFTVYLSLKIIMETPPLLLYLTAVSFAVISFPVKFTLGMGQNNILALAFLIGSYYLYRKSRKNLAGIVLGISLVLKPIFLFFFLFFILKKQWRILIVATGCVLAAMMTVFLLYNGPFLYAHYFFRVVPPLATAEGREIYYNQGLMGFISRLTPDIASRKQITALLSCVLVVSSGIQSVKNSSKNNPQQFGILIITLVLIDTLSWQHHFVLLIYAYITATAESVRQYKPIRTVLLIASYALVSVNIARPERILHPILLSHGFYGALLLYIVTASFLPIPFTSNTEQTGLRQKLLSPSRSQARKPEVRKER